LSGLWWRCARRAVLFGVGGCKPTEPALFAVNRFPYIAKAFPFASQRGPAVQEFFTRADFGTLIPVHASNRPLPRRPSITSNQTTNFFSSFFFFFSFRSAISRGLLEPVHSSPSERRQEELGTSGRLSFCLSLSHMVEPQFHWPILHAIMLCATTGFLIHQVRIAGRFARFLCSRAHTRPLVYRSTRRTSARRCSAASAQSKKQSQRGLLSSRLVGSVGRSCLCALAVDHGTRTGLGQEKDSQQHRDDKEHQVAHVPRLALLDQAG
jgi:hypothetical protein